MNEDTEITNTTFDKKQMKMEHCKSLVVQDLARITIMFESKKYVRTKTDKRVSFSESFGAFGKVFTTYISLTLRGQSSTFTFNSKEGILAC